MVIVLELENICGFFGRHKFEFREGLNEVIAPNASGKTSLIKALLSMYAPETIPAEELLNLDSDEGYIKLEIDGDTYIRKFRREKDKVIEVESKPITKDPRLKYIVLDPQLGEIVNSIVTKAKADVTDYLTHTFKLDELRKKRDILRSEIERLKKEIEHLREEVVELRVYEEEKRKIEEERKKKLEELERLKEVSIEKAKEIQTRISDLNRRLGEIESRIKDLEERLIPMMRERLKEYQQEIEKLKQIVHEFYNKYPDPDVHIDNLKKLIMQIDAQIDEWKKEQLEIITGQDARIAVVKMAMITRSVECPVCGKPIENPDVWNTRLRELMDEVKSIKESIIKSYESKISNAEQERTRLWKELEKVIKEYNEIREVKSIKLPRYELELSNLTKTLEAYNKEIEKLKKEKVEVIKELESLKQTLSREEQEAAIRRENIEKELGIIEQKLRDLEEYIIKMNERSKELFEKEQMLKERQKELNDIENEFYSILTNVKEIFARVANEVIKELNFIWLKAIRLISDIEGKRFEIKIVRILPSGREVEQSLSTLSTSERLAVSLITILTGYKLKLLEEYKGKVPIIADEALLAFDPYRFAKVIEELKKYARYIIVTRLAEPNKVPQLTIVHKE